VTLVAIFVSSKTVKTMRKR